MPTSVKTLRNKCDRLLQEYNREHNEFCEVCGNPCTVGHHYVPKSLSNRLRYEIKNIISLCNGCHMGIHQRSDPKINETIVSQRGEEWAEWINKTRSETVKTTIGWYNEQIENLKNL